MNADQPKPELKLYVVGESSGNPADWSEWFSERSFLMAVDEKQAMEMAGDSRVAMVDPPSPCVIATIWQHVFS